MRYIIIFFLIYLVIRTISRALQNIQIRSKKASDFKAAEPSSESKLKLNEDQIEDAEFKDISSDWYQLLNLEYDHPIDFTSMVDRPVSFSYNPCCEEVE